MQSLINAPSIKFSKSLVVGSGKAIVANRDTADEALCSAFRNAHAWRNLHLTPMRRVRAELSRHLRKIDGAGVSAGRLKRFQSIRAKLKSGRVSLYQMQDLAGVRAICKNVDAVNQVCSTYLSGKVPHRFIRETDYIASPKADGYRSRHIVLQFTGPEAITGGNRIIFELQVRTELQHAWATAVEAVGLVRGEDLKGGKGHQDWLRFFTLMSAEFAAEEATACVPGVPSHDEHRRAEIREVAERIEAISTLESYNRAIYHTEGYLGLKGHSYVIQYDERTREVSVRSFSSFSNPLDYVHDQEELQSGSNTIIVEIDKVGDLREAYPNYFLDVRMFTDRLKAALRPATLSGEKGDVRVERKPSKWAKYIDFLSVYPERSPR